MVLQTCLHKPTDDLGFTVLHSQCRVTDGTVAYVSCSVWLHPARGEWVESQPRTAKLIHHLQNDWDAAGQGWPLVLRLEWA